MKTIQSCFLQLGEGSAILMVYIVILAPFFRCLFHSYFSSALSGCSLHKHPTLCPLDCTDAVNPWCIAERLSEHTHQICLTDQAQAYGWQQLPSRISTSVSGTLVCDWTQLSMQVRSTFAPRRKLPCCDIDGGYACFSCLNNSLRLPSLVWQAIQSLENKAQSFFKDDNCNLSLDCIFGGGRLKSGSLFFLIVSDIGIWPRSRSVA